MLKKTQNTIYLFTFILSLFGVGVGALLLNSRYPNELLVEIANFSFSLSTILMVLKIVSVLLEHRIDRGLKYFWKHWTMTNSLTRQLIDSGFYIKREKNIEIPKFQINFDKDLKSGEIKIKNSIKFNNKLHETTLSPALGEFVVESNHISNSGNFQHFEILNEKIISRKIFSGVDQFLQFNSTIDKYKLFLDSRWAVDLQHTLLVGQTGSGKSYALFSLILQMLHKATKYELYFADPKHSSISVMGNKIDPTRTAVEIEDIISLFENFVAKMNERKGEMKEKLAGKLVADYRTFELSPNVFIFDEYASFVSAVQTMDKKTRDHVNDLMRQVTLQGRQLGFFVFLVMQKSDATLVDTLVRENLPLKIVLGNAEAQTYLTAFGNGVQIPKQKFSVGEGVFKVPVLATELKTVKFPFLDFDILAVASKAPVG